MVPSESIGRGQETLQQSASSLLTKSQFRMLKLHVLDKPLVIEALFNHMISLQDIEEQFENLSEAQIVKIGSLALPHQSCIDAIIDGRTTIEQLAEMDEDDLVFTIESDSYSRPGLR